MNSPYRALYPTSNMALPSRHALSRCFSSEIEQCFQDKTYGAVICLGIHRFDRLRSLYGLFVTDSLIKELLSRMQDVVTSDEIIISLGSDEFLILLSCKSTDRWQVEDYAKQVSTRLVAVTDTPFYIDTHSLTISLSVGVAHFPDTSETVDSLVQKAVNALSQAKVFPGRNVQFFNQGRTDLINKHHEIERDLNQALRNNEFALHYQPIVEIASGAVTGAEVLLRWHHPAKGPIAPDVFIPVAEETGQILDIGTWVFSMLAHQFSQWLQMGLRLENFGFSVNISPRQFMEQDFVEKILLYLDGSCMKPENLRLEITENIAMADLDMTAYKISVLKAFGVCCAIDDFGTGYSSLTYLKHLPCGAIKIDKSFINDFMSNMYSRAIVESTINLAKAFQLTVIAEGVESGDQFLELKKLGCHYYQGYFYSPAVPPHEFFMQLK